MKNTFINIYGPRNPTAISVPRLDKDGKPLPSSPTFIKTAVKYRRDETGKLFAIHFVNYGQGWLKTCKRPVA
jgi:hypothetical protein